MFHNISELQELLEQRTKALQVSEARFRNIIEKSADGIVIVDRNGIVQFINPMGEFLFGRKAEELVGKLFGFPVVAGETTELDILHRDGEITIAEMRVVEIEWEGEIAYLASIRDITERKRVEQLKDEFVSTVSHELRTPLSIIREAISLVLDEIPGKIVEPQRDVLITAGENTKRLSRIIDSLLDISKIESRELELRRSVVNITDLIKDTASDFEHLAQEKKISFDYELPQREANVFIDADKVRQVLVNLISNALKFTPRNGRVKVICNKGEDEVIVSVRDTGIGILMENIPKLFDKFTQFGRRPGPGEKGTGLGLAISKGIVELHGGRIWVESELGKGSKFYFSLPRLGSQKIFKEYLSNGIKEAREKRSPFSVGMFSIMNFKELIFKSHEKIEEILPRLRKVIKNTLRRKSDIVVNDTGEILVILPHTKKDEAISILEITKEKLREFLLRGGDLKEKIDFTTAVISYPTEAKEEEEMLSKLREAKYS